MLPVIGIRIIGVRFAPRKTSYAIQRGFGTDRRGTLPSVVLSPSNRICTFPSCSARNDSRPKTRAIMATQATRQIRRVMLVLPQQEHDELMSADVKRVRPKRSSAASAAKSSEPSVQVKGIEACIRAGVDVGEADKNGVTILHHAVRFRSPAAVRALIAMGANVNQTCKRSGSTPLHRAVTSTGAPGTAGMQAEAREIVALLLAAGSDPSIRNKNGKTPGDYATDEIIQARLVASLKTA